MWSLLPLTVVLLNGIQSYIISDPDIFSYLDIFKEAFWEADNEEARQPYRTQAESERDKIWLLDVVPGDQELRRPSDHEAELFENSFGDLIESYEERRALGYAPRPHPRAAAATSRNSTDGLEDKTVLDRIRTTVNKFILSSLQEREQHLEDCFSEGANPSITLYIKSPYSAIVISYGDRQWNFFLRPPSPLPAWLYEPHQTATDVKPNKAIDVKRDRTTAIAIDGFKDDENTIDFGEDIMSLDVKGGKVGRVSKEVTRPVNVKVPSDVQSALYRALLRYLRVALRFDLS